MEPRAFLRALFDAAVAAADPAVVLPAHLPEPPRGRTIVVGAGKASAAMGLALERHWPGELSGLIVTRYGHGAPCQRIEVVEAAHPVPDEAGRAAAARILELVGGLGEDDLVLALISGGGSALLTLPPDGLSLADKQGDQPGAAALGRLDRRDELRAQASLAHQGRPARRRGLARAHRLAADLRRARRRPGGDRQRPDRARPDHGGRRARRSSPATASSCPTACAGIWHRPRPRPPSPAIPASPAPRPG